MSDPRSENARRFATEGGKVTGVDLAFLSFPGSRFELLRAALIDEQTAQGQTIARVIVKDKDDVEMQVSCFLAWPWPGWQPPSGFANRLLPGSSNFPYEHVIVNKYDPPAQGPLAIYIGDRDGNVQSDVIGGLGLPHGHHVSFHLVYRERRQESVPPVPPPGGEEAPPTGDLLARLERIEAKLDRLGKHLGLNL